MKTITLLLFIAGCCVCCKKEQDVCVPEQVIVNVQSPITLHPITGFWFYKCGNTSYGSQSSYIYPNLQAVGQRFMLFEQDSVAVFLDDCSVNNFDAGIFRKPYIIKADSSLVVRLNPELFFTDSIYYPTLSGDSLILKTRGYVHPNPNITDSVYDKLIFTRNL